jgi:hypothetical protein
MWEKIQALDRRWIYLVFIIAVLFPLFKPLGLPQSIGEDVQNFYDKFSAIPAGSVVWLSGDYSAGASAECDPQFEVIIKHCFAKNLKVIVYSMWDQGALLVKKIAERVANQMGKLHGTDWVYLGWRPGNQVTIRLAGEDLWTAMLNVDGYDEPLSDHPMMANIRRLWSPDIYAVVCFSSGSPGDGDYMQYITDLCDTLLFTGQVAVQAPSRVPLIRSGQMQGLVPGMGGAAQYEVLAGFPGKAAGLMDAQSLAHVVVIAFVILGNIALLASGKRG